MKTYSTREAAKRLGLHLVTLQTYIAAGKIPAPPLLRVGEGKLRAWKEADIDKVRKTLPKIANGRKTRWQRQRAAEKEKQGKAKKTKTQARAPALQKKKVTPKKK